MRYNALMSIWLISGSVQIKTVIGIDFFIQNVLAGHGNVLDRNLPPFIQHPSSASCLLEKIKEGDDPI